MAESTEKPEADSGSVIDKYISVVEKRKSINRKNTTPQVNYAILSQLEDKDIPLLIEIIRTQSRALEAVIQINEDFEDGQSLTQPIEQIIVGICANAYVKSSELAELGSTNRWGGVDAYSH